MKLYAFQPHNYGEYSFFVMAASEEDARAAVDAWIAAAKPYEQPDDAWPGNYEMTVADAGQVLLNPND